MVFLRCMVRDGMQRKSSKIDICKARKNAKKGNNDDLEKINWAWKHTNNKIMNITKTNSLQYFIENQNLKWVAHVIRGSNENINKQLMFPDEKLKKVGQHHKTILERVLAQQEAECGKSADAFLHECLNRHV